MPRSIYYSNLMWPIKGKVVGKTFSFLLEKGFQARTHVNLSELKGALLETKCNVVKFEMSSIIVCCK
jgi:hypothetical protein